MNDTWEYKTLDYKERSFWTGTVKIDNLEAQLNELGRQGWELVSSAPLEYFRSTRSLTLIFKRRR
jgi:Domain of unknown function (DUF4177)